MDNYMESLAGGLIQEPGVYEPIFNNRWEMISGSEINAEQGIYSPRIPTSIDVPPMAPTEKSRKVGKSICWISSGATELNTTLKTTTSSTIFQFETLPNTNIVHDGRPTLENETSMFSRASEWAEKIINKEKLKSSHVIAERKRREKLNQRFIELSAVIPGRKKMDTSSVLSDAIMYVKQLQEKVKCLENKNIGPAFLIKRSPMISSTGDNSSSDDNFDKGASCKTTPQLEVKLSGQNVLIRIQCDKGKGVLAKVLKVIEDLNLTVTSTSAIPFTMFSIDITITAQIDGEFDMTANDLIKKLSSDLNQFM